MKPDQNAPAVSLADVAELKKKLLADEMTSKALILQFIALRREISITRAKIDQCETQRTHISILPFDTLALIFSNISEPMQGLYEPAFNPDLLHLSHVCTRWRKMIIYTPTLWAKNIRIFDGCPRQLFELYLERAKQCPLDVSYNEIPRDANVAHRRIRTDEGFQSISALLSCIGRCRKLEAYICGPNSECLDVLADVSAPRLETLVLDNNYTQPRWFTGSPIQILNGGAPRLSSLSLKSIPPTSVGIGGRNLITCLRIQGHWDPRRVLDHLREFPFLKTLQLSDIPSFDFGNSAPVELHHLKFLDISSVVVETEIPGTILSMVHAPVLCHLVLDINSIQEKKKFKHPMKRDLPAFPMLQKLTIKIRPSPHSDRRILPIYIHYFPNIVHLEVLSLEWSHYLRVKPIVEIFGSEVDWPLLKQLTVTHPIDEQGMDGLIEFVKGRWKAGKPLHKVVVLRGTSNSRSHAMHQSRWLEKVFDDVSGLVTPSDILDMNCMNCMYRSTVE